MARIIKPPIPVQTILDAAQGSEEALNAVLRHYHSYICCLSIRPGKNELGIETLCIDESMRQQLEAKLIYSIVTAFQILPM